MWDLLAGMKSLVYTWRSWTCNSLLNPWTCNPQATSLWLSMSVYWTALTEASHLVQRPDESWVTLCAKKSICENLSVGVWCQRHKNWNNTRCSRGVSCQCGWHDIVNFLCFISFRWWITLTFHWHPHFSLCPIRLDGFDHIQCMCALSCILY